nr:MULTISPECIES: contractile injection system protein, VgrG/Pvc8 family [unclassified Xenorhabdus]
MGVLCWEFEFNLKNTYPKREQINQANESDRDFIERLLSEVGIFYTFRLQPDTQTEVIHFGDKQRCYEFDKNLPFNTPSGMSDNGQDSIWGLTLRRQVVESSVQTKDYNYRTTQHILNSAQADMTRGDGEDITYGDVTYYKPRHLTTGDKLQPEPETANFWAWLDHERFFVSPNPAICSKYRSNADDRPSRSNNTLNIAQCISVSHFVDASAFQCLSGDCITSQNNGRSFQRNLVLAPSTKVTPCDQQNPDSQHYQPDQEKWGEGFELRSDSWGAIRAGKGLFISADKQPSAQGEVLDMGSAQSQLAEALIEMQTLTASKQLDIGATKRFTLATGGIMSFFSRLGARLFSAKGNINIQAQGGDIATWSTQDTHISSGKRTVISANDELTLMCGGAFIKLTGGNVEIGGPGALLVKNGGIQKLDAESMKNAMQSFTPESFNERFIISHPLMGKPVANQSYELHMPDGRIIEGITNSEGQTTLVESEMIEGLKIILTPQKLTKLCFCSTWIN